MQVEEPGSAGRVGSALEARARAEGLSRHTVFDRTDPSRPTSGTGDASKPAPSAGDAAKPAPSAGDGEVVAVRYIEPQA